MAYHRTRYARHCGDGLHICVKARAPSQFPLARLALRGTLDWSKKMKTIYRIHPGIGIARVGNSPDDFFIGPEAPGIPPTLKKPGAPRFPKGKYKDDQGRIK